MARNEFGCICDICGAVGRKRDLTDNMFSSNMFFKIRIPTYQSRMNNSTQLLDYCPDCYDDLKKALAKHYNIEWED